MQKPNFPTFGLRVVATEKVVTLDGIHSEIGFTLLKDGLQTLVSIKTGEEIHVVKWHSLVRALEALTTSYVMKGGAK